MLNLFIFLKTLLLFNTVKTQIVALQGIYTLEQNVNLYLTGKYETILYKSRQPLNKK